MSMTDEAISELKQQLIQTWNGAETALKGATLGGPRFQSLNDSRRPRAGLAIGHAKDVNTGKTRLELRVTAAAGPNLVFARKLAEDARSQGIEAELRVVHRPVIAPIAQSIQTQVNKQSADMNETRVRRRPLHLGLSVGHERGGAGSLGAFVRTPEGHVGILSCTHVLARGGQDAVKSGDLIHQPGPADQDPFLPSNRVGALTDHFAPFIPNQVNNLDAAVARVEPDPPLGP